MSTLLILGPGLERARIEAQRLEVFQAGNAAAAVADLTRNASGPDTLEKIPFGPYSGTTNQLLAAMVFGGQAIDFETITVTASAAVGLTPPVEARYAVIVCEADPSDTPQTSVVRFRQDPTDPTSATGHPIGHQGVVEIKGVRNLARVKFIGIRADKTHKLQVQYFI